MTNPNDPASPNANVVSALVRETMFAPAFDKRNKDPKKDYGIHGVELRMYLKGKHGVVQFVLYTQWNLPHVQDDLDAKCTANKAWMYRPIPADLGYHSPTPMYEGQTSMDTCHLLGGLCYYDGSGLNAERIYDVLLTEVSDGVWRELENYYYETFAKITP